MPTLELNDVPSGVYRRLVQLAALHQRTPETEAIILIQQGVGGDETNQAQAELLSQLRRRSFIPPPGTPDSAELMREDRDR